jgi:ferredoxin--NADP+ reductase
VIGTNKKDSQDTVDTLVADLTGRPRPEFTDDHAEEISVWLHQRQPRLITEAHWRAIDSHERAAGEPHGRPRVKLPSMESLLHVGHG